MLCRALTAALAVICTLSLAHGQARRLDRIKDLMCVFLLSGMQKEDLDVNMLTKLQQHNVNIDELNNEQLLQECLQAQKDNISEKFTNITETAPRINKVKSAVPDNLETNGAFQMLKKSLDTDNDRYNLTAEYTKSREFQENEKTLKKKSKRVLLNYDRQPDFERPFKYIDHKKVNKAIKEKSDFTNDQDNTRILNSSEEDTLNKMLGKFLSRRRNFITKATTRQKTVNIGDGIETIQSFRRQDIENNTNNVNRDFKRLSYVPFQRNERRTPNDIEIIDRESMINRQEPITTNNKNVSNELTLLNVLKSVTHIPDANNNNKDKNSTLNSFLKLERLDTTRPLIVLPKQEISRAMIKEIADSVKEIVLRDLRKELHYTTVISSSSSSITTSTTITMETTKSTTKLETTESITQTTIKKENIKIQDSVMNKFLELFEEIKALKQNTLLIAGKNKKDTRQNVDIKDLNVNPKLEMVPSPKTIQIQLRRPTYANQIYRINQDPTGNSGNFYNFVPDPHTYKSNIDPTVIKLESKEINKIILPITVQTNNIEIPPLRIPLDKPQNLISQNIVVTAKVPYRIVTTKNKNVNSGPIKKDNLHRTSQQHTQNFYNKYKSAPLNPHLIKEQQSPPSRHFHSNHKNNVIRFTLNENLPSKNNADYYEKINIAKYNPLPNSDEIRHQEIPRFHEKMEKAERYLDYAEQYKYAENNDCCNKKFGYSQTMVDCCDRKIASRQQMSINNMKKSYDDKHFKKFLQSQQKVTDMLEKILGDKGNVHSVETA